MTRIIKEGLNPAKLTLCLCGVTHTYLLFSVLPYKGYMSVWLLPSRVTVDSVGLYAGSLGAAFSGGQYLGFVPWKAVRGRAGGKKSLLYSLSLSGALSIWFGLSRSYVSAIVARFCLGFANNISGCIMREAMDQEEAGAGSGESTEGQHRDEHLPARVLAVMWWGAAIGPLLGGILSYPGNLAPFLQDHFPFLLPNIVAAGLCLVSIAAVAAFIKNRGNSTTSSPSEGSVVQDGEHRPLLRASMIRSVQLVEFSLWQESKDIWKSKNTRDHLIAYWIFSFVVVCIEEALPLFFIARRSGPGLSEKTIGLLLGLSGLIVALSQHSTLEYLFEDTDLYSSLRMGSLFGTVPCALFALALVMNGGTYDALDLDSDFGSLNLLSGVYLTALTAFMSIFNSLYFAFSGVAIARTVPHNYRDAAARVLTLGALLARTVAPIIAGALVSSLLSLPSHGAVALWLILGLLCGSGAAAMNWYLREAGHGSNAHTDERRRLYLDRRQRAEIFVKLWEVHYEKDPNTVSSKWRRLTRKTIVANRLARNRGNPPPAVTEDAGVTEQQEPAPRMSWFDYILHPGMDVDKVPFFIVGTTKNDSCSPHVLTPPLMQALHKELPMAIADCNFWLRYSLVRDGASIIAIETKAGMSKNTILAIETLDGNVFGCFMTTPWRVTGSFVVSPESFLWRMKKRRIMPEQVNENTLDYTTLQESEVEVFRWTGENSMCQLLALDRIAAGGGIVDGKGDGFGFIVEDGLMSGNSNTCATYNNPCLCPDSKNQNGRFEVANMEIWAMTPFLFSADAERGESHMHFIEENLSNAEYKETPILTQSAWSNFL